MGLAAFVIALVRTLQVSPAFDVATLFEHFSVVVSPRSCPQMIWVNTGWNIATVQQTLTMRNWPDKKFVDKSMSFIRTTIATNDSVALLGFGRAPDPTTSDRHFDYFGRDIGRQLIKPGERCLEERLAHLRDNPLAA
jgi:hypothetical protein